MIKMSKSTMFGFKVEQTLKPMIERFNESITGEGDYTCTMWIREHGAADLYIYTHEKEYTPAKICKLIIEKFELTKFKKVAK